MSEPQENRKNVNVSLNLNLKKEPESFKPVRKEDK